MAIYSSMIKAIIFDLDGVIVDTEPLNKLCMREFLVTLGVSDNRELPKNIQGLNTKSYWTRIKEAYDIEATIDEIVSSWRPYYLSYLDALDQIPVISGIPELIDYFTGTNYSLAVASSANPKRIKLILDKIKLAEPFEIIVDGDAYKEGKPAPDCFLLAAQRLAIEPKHCVVIEDSTNGIRAAKAAKMRCIAYGGSYHNNDDQSEANIIINDFSELAASLNRGVPLPV